MPLGKLQLLAAACIVNGMPLRQAVQVLTSCNLRCVFFFSHWATVTCTGGGANGAGATVTCTGGLFLWPTSADTLLAHVVVATVTCTGGLFLWPTSTDTLLAQVVVAVTCTGGLFLWPTRHRYYWHRWWWLWYCNLHCVVVVVVFFSRAMVHILNVCIVICTVWRWWWQSFSSRNACGGRNIVTCTVWWW